MKSIKDGKLQVSLFSFSLCLAFSPLLLHMAFQEGESSSSKSTASDSPNTPLTYNHPNTPSPAPQDPMNDLEHAYAALEIDDEVPDGLELE
nr:hypothetical protein Itr_chr13CG17050 [Ipomoea trifida]